MNEDYNRHCADLLLYPLLFARLEVVPVQPSISYSREESAEEEDFGIESLGQQDGYGDFLPESAKPTDTVISTPIVEL